VARDRQVWAIQRTLRSSLPSTGGSEVHVVDGAADAGWAAVEDVSVDHGCAHVAVAQEFLDGPDVAVVLQQVRGKRMTQGVTRGSFRDPGPAYGVLDGALHD
jgi:hypothetical protein